MVFHAPSFFFRSERLLGAVQRWREFLVILNVTLRLIAVTAALQAWRAVCCWRPLGAASDHDKGRIPSAGTDAGPADTGS
jgi:hypothetical protein